MAQAQGINGSGMAGINLGAGSTVVFFGAIRTDDDEHGEPMVVTSTGMSVKVTPLASYPAKGRATNGVRAQRFLKGEVGLRLAWVVQHRLSGRTAGPRPPPRRLGSAHPGPDVIGHLIERD